MQKVQSKTKVIATLGPASSSKEVLEQMIAAGVDVCRINFSHGSYDDHAAVINTIREINAERGHHTAILADLQGPKLRIGEVENNGVQLNEGDDVVITTEKSIGTAKRDYITYPQFPQDVKIGETVLIDDGKIEGYLIFEYLLFKSSVAGSILAALYLFIVFYFVGRGSYDPFHPFFSSFNDMNLCRL